MLVNESGRDEVSTMFCKLICCVTTWKLVLGASLLVAFGYDYCLDCVIVVNDLVSLIYIEEIASKSLLGCGLGLWTTCRLEYRQREP